MRDSFLIGRDDCIATPTLLTLAAASLWRGRGDRSYFVAIDRAVFHDESDIADACNVVEWVPVNRYEVSIITISDRADSVT